jgi:hypothetical protein
MSDVDEALRELRRALGVAADEDATSTSSSNATTRAGDRGARGEAREALARLRRALDLH